VRSYIVPQDILGDDDGAVKAAQQIGNYGCGRSQCQQSGHAAVGQERPNHALFLLIALLPYRQDDGRPLKTKRIADAVFQIALIGEMEQPGIVAEHDKMGRPDSHLGHVIDLKPPALIGGGLYPGLGIREHIVQHSGGDAGGRVIADVVDQLEQPIHTLTRECRNEQDGCVGHEAQIPADIGTHVIHGLVILFHQIPLVHHDDGRLAGLVRHACHLGVLIGDALLGVDENQTHIRPLNGHGGPQHAVLFDVLLHLGSAAHTGGVDEHEGSLIVFKAGVDGIPGSSGHVADDCPVLPQNFVN